MILKKNNERKVPVRQIICTFALMMKHFRVFFLRLAAMLLSAEASAQTLSVSPVEATRGGQVTLTVNMSQPSGASALQFCLLLPEGFTVNDDDCRVKQSAAGHVLSVTRMDNGHHLFVLYSTDLQLMTEGALLSVPVDIADDAAEGSGRLYSVCSSGRDAVSTQISPADFSITLHDSATRMDACAAEGTGSQTIYNLNGQRLSKPQKGLNVIGGRLVLRGCQ